MDMSRRAEVSLQACAVLVLIQAAVAGRIAFAADSNTKSAVGEPAAPNEKENAAPAEGLPRAKVALRDGFGEGWKQTVRIAPKREQSAAYDLWVQGGWFYVCRTDEQGDLDWQIKLAQVEQSDVPSVSTIVVPGKFTADGNDEAIGFHVSLRDGRYFIRETLDVLRSVRQRSEGGGAVARTELLGDELTSSSWGRAGPPLNLTLSSWSDGTWFYVASGPDENRFDCLVRLNPVGWSKPGYGVRSAAGDMASMFHGQKDLWDDGELLLASRTLRADYEQELVRQKIRKKLPGAVPPEIEASEWLNTEPLAWADLRGKVVLLDFWATSCGPCVKSLPDVQQLADKYGEEGLVVIGIHSKADAETCADFVAEKKLTFPMAIDRGPTADRYAVDSLPSYFLVDKTGRVIDGWSAKLPDEETIRKLLSAAE